MNDDFKNAIELIFVLAWTYGVGYFFAALTPFDFDPIRTAALFGFIGFWFAAFGIERRRATGRYPPGISLMLFGFLFTCLFLSVGIYILQWLGLF